MAKVIGGKDGAISGMIGPVVFYKYNGNQYARKASKKRGKNSWSPKQVMYRKKVSGVGAFWRRFMHTPVKQVFEIAAEQLTAYNLFLKTNLPAFSPDGETVDFEWLHLSAGKLPLPHKLNAGLVAEDSEKAEVTWQDDSGNGLALQRDELLVMVAHEGKFTGPIATGFIRRHEAAIIQLPSGIGTIQGIYLSFASKERMLYSPDQYFEI